MLDWRMLRLVRPRSLRPGDRVAVLSPSWAVPAVFPAIHEQALRRLRTVVGVEPVEFPSTRRASSPRERADDLNTAFADPSIRAVLATIGGDDQITVLRYLDSEAVLRDPTWFVGYSDNTNILNWLWYQGIAALHGGATQVHVGPGPAVDAVHLQSLRAALFGGDVELRPLAESRTPASTGPIRAPSRNGRQAFRPSRGPGPGRRSVLRARSGAETSRS